MQGDIASITYSDAHEFAVEMESDSSWMQWPMEVEDGDMAVFLQRFSDHKLDFKLTGRESFGSELLDEYGYISKNIGAQYSSIAICSAADTKTDDDVLESPLQVRFQTDDAENPISSPSVSSINGDHMREAVDIDDVNVEVEVEGEGHGINGNGEKATCMLLKKPHGLIDCVRCIQDSLQNILSQLRREDHADDAVLLDSLYRNANLAGADGIVAEVVKVRPLHLVCL